jgi:hypothetical protein
MAIVLAELDLTMEVDDDSFLEEGEDVSYSFREIMDMLIEKRDIILTVPADQVPALKKGLYTRKGKDVQKLTRAGIRSGNEVLSFLTYHPKDAEGKEIEDQMCVRVRLGARKSVTIINVEIPDDTL